MWPSLATLWLLYVTFFNIGILCFGGGYAAVQLSQEQTVNIHHWMTMGDFGSIVTMSEMPSILLSFTSSAIFSISLALFTI